MERLPVKIVIESKAPRKKLDGYIDQLEGYVFHKHRRDQMTIAILTDGNFFIIYVVNGPLYKGYLNEHRLMSFTRTELGTMWLARKILEVFGKESNQQGKIVEALAAYRKEREDISSIDADIQSLILKRDQIDSQISDLQKKKEILVGVSVQPDRDLQTPTYSKAGGYKSPASEHIFRLLTTREAFNRTRGVERKWLDEQLINKVDGVRTRAAVSWGIIELRDDYQQIECEGKNPIRKIWLR